MKKTILKVLSAALIISMCLTGTAFSEMLTDVETDGEYSAETAVITDTTDFVEATDTADVADIADTEVISSEPDTSEVPVSEGQEAIAEESFVFEEVIESDTVIFEEEVLEIPVAEFPQTAESEEAQNEFSVPAVNGTQVTTDVQPKETPLEILLEEMVEDEEVELEELFKTDYSPLYYGMYSYPVYYLQKALRYYGYDTPADGYFGNETAVAVAIFQMYNGLEVTYYADAKVQELIWGNCVKFYSFGKGTYSKAVASLQTQLKNLGYLDSVVDGYFGSSTEAAVKEFQEMNNLYVDGSVGMQTLKTLVYYPIAASGSRALALKELSRGDTGSAVKRLQKRLAETGYLTTAVDGDYGIYTVWAVAVFQMYNDLTITGKLDINTINMMNSSQALSYRSLSIGDNSNSTKGLQRVLQKLGYDIGDVDGDFGNVTRKALVMFQRINGISPADGILGAVTIYKLFKNPKSYDPNAELEYSEVEILAMNVLDQVGWNLYSAFEWSVGMGYNLQLDIGYTTSQTAIYSFNNYYGNCISMATTFYWMARMLGYNVRTIYGSVPYRSGGSGPHAWVEIDVNGGTYICDPDFEMQTGKNGYLIYYGQSGTWRYQYGYILSDY